VDCALYFCFLNEVGKRAMGVFKDNKFSIRGDFVIPEKCAYKLEHLISEETKG
jgi:hypothetical protein